MTARHGSVSIAITLTEQPMPSTSRRMSAMSCSASDPAAATSRTDERRDELIAELRARLYNMRWTRIATSYA